MSKKSIKISKALFAVWKKELVNQTECASETGLNRWTVNKAINTGRCTENTMNRINMYLLRKRDTSSATKLTSK